MLVEFNVANFKSIKKKQTLSLIAAPIVSKDERVDQNNVFEAPSGISLLKSVAIYGANASGKSNLVKALLKMMLFIDRSFRDEAEINKFETFALDGRSKKKPIHLELVFIVKKKQYRYGFEVTNKKISAEWLFGPAKTNEVEYFTRTHNQIAVNKSSFREGESLTEGKTKDSTLFLNVVHAFNGQISKEIKDFLQSSITITTGMNDAGLRSISREMLRNPELHPKILQLLKAADTGITEIRNIDVNKVALAGPVPAEIKKKIDEGEEYQLLTSLREIKNADAADVNRVFIFDQFESEGTKKFFTYAGPIVESLLLGTTLVVDELDARLHPSLTRRIVEIFNSNEFNGKNAQLIFVTHDINLLDSALLRRDQIYFAEKNTAGESSFYSLINVGGVRNDASFEKDYIKGKYGAIPFLGDFKIQ